MTDSQGVVRRISWHDLFPWLILLRTFRIAVSPAALAVATAAVLVAPLGWGLADGLFRPFAPAAGDEEAEPAPPDRARQRERAVLERVEWPRRIPRAENSRLEAEIPRAAAGYLPAARTALLEGYLDFAEPLRRLFQLQLTVRELAYYLFGALWTLAVWSLPGGFLTRRALVQLATESSAGVQDTFRFAWRRYLWYFAAPLYPLLGVAMLTVPIALLGLPLRVMPGLGAVLAGLLWLLVVVLSLGAMWLLLGLIFGWPLMWPTISAERDGDPFEAFSRSYSYVYGQPLRYFFYVVVAAALGALGWAAVNLAATIVQEFGFWALAWGGGGERVSLLRREALNFVAGLPPSPGGGRLESVGAKLIGLAVGLVQAAATAFRYTYFFAASSAIYLLLRHAVDDKEMDEVYREPSTGAPPPTQSTTATPGAPATTSPAGASTPSSAAADEIS